MNRKRPLCGSCKKPLTTCICRYLVNIEHNIEVIVWRHPSESKNAKNTADLLKMCLANCRIEDGEVFSPERLAIENGRCALLYPGGKLLESSSVHAGKAQFTQLLLIDGTWRKSRKILHLNPWLAHMPCYTFNSVSSAYRIRKAEQNGQLSTFEAGALALRFLENDGMIERSLMAVFEKFVGCWEDFVPTSVLETDKGGKFGRESKVICPNQTERN